MIVTRASESEHGHLPFIRDARLSKDTDLNSQASKSVHDCQDPCRGNACRGILACFPPAPTRRAQDASHTPSPTPSHRARPHIQPPAPWLRCLSIASLGNNHSQRQSRNLRYTWCTTTIYVTRLHDHDRNATCIPIYLNLYNAPPSARVRRNRPHRGRCTRRHCRPGPRRCFWSGQDQDRFLPVGFAAARSRTLRGFFR
jgi:hypothetical protein